VTSRLLRAAAALLAFSFLAAASAGVDAQPSTAAGSSPPPGPPPGSPPGLDRSSPVPAINAFAADLYRRLADREGNLFFSPASLVTALAMTYGGARGRTAAEMAEVLHLPGGAEDPASSPSDRPTPSRSSDPAGVHASFGRLLHALTEPREVPVYDREAGKTTHAPAYDLEIANALWVQRDFALREEFLSLVRQHYGAGASPVDFRDAPAARDRINAWAAEATRDKIRDLIPPGLLDSQTRLVLTDAIYFRSNWEHEFLPSATDEAEFRLAAAGGPVRVPMMHAQREYRYAEDNRLQAVELPYLEGELALVVLLPRAVDGLGEIERNLTGDGLRQTLDGLEPETVQLSLPRFRFESAFLLSEVLQAMGMASAFSDTADFSGMTGEAQLQIGEVVHKAFVALDEKGTEAAAATAVIEKLGAAMTAPEPVGFTADHPFLFLIRHQASGAILFLGRVADPRA